MNKKLLYFLLPVFFALFIDSCKKYPEGGNTSWAKQKIEGYWDLENLTVNGDDSTAHIKDGPQYCSYPIIFVDIHDHDDYSLLINSSCVATLWAIWELSKNKKQLETRFEKDTLNGEIFPLIINEYTYVVWDIKKLTNKQMWLKTNYNTKEYFIKLNKKPE